MKGEFRWSLVITIWEQWEDVFGFWVILCPFYASVARISLLCCRVATSRELVKVSARLAQLLIPCDRDMNRDRWLWLVVVTTDVCPTSPDRNLLASVLPPACHQHTAQPRLPTLRPFILHCRP